MNELTSNPKINAAPVSVDGLIVTGGCQRSGTTLVHRLVAGHPDIHGVLTDWAVFDRIEYFSHWTGIKEPSSSADMLAALEKLLRHDYLKKWSLTIEDVRDLVADFEPSWDSVFLCMVAALRRKENRQRIALKHPGGEEFFIHLKQLFERRNEDIRLIYSVRSPIDTYLSHKYRAHAWVGGEHTDETPTQWSSYWLESTSYLLEFSYRYSDSIRIVRYEDVVAQPLEAAAEICRFLGVDDHASTMVQLDDFQANSSFDNTEVGHTVGGVVNVNDRPRPQLTQRELDVLRIACGRRAEIFGYDLGAVKSPPEHSRKVMNEVALEPIPSQELIGSASRVLARRVWSRLFHRSAVCKAPRLS